MEVNNNLISEILQNKLKLSQKDVQDSIVKISTGQKSSAVEDAANFILGQVLESQSRGSQVALENSQTGINTLQVADSGMESINENLQRMRELSLKAANGTNSETDLKAIKSEMSALTDEINRVAKTTSFNDKSLLDGSSLNLTIYTGYNSETSSDSLNIGSALNSVTSKGLGLMDSKEVQKSLNTSEDFLNYVDGVDSAINQVTAQRAAIGANQNALESNINSLDTVRENLLATQSRIRDTDIAAELSRLTQSQILSDASANLIAQANQMPAVAMTLL